MNLQKQVFTLKKIKTLKEKKKRLQAQSSLQKREKTPISFFLDPFQYHLIMSDLIICDNISKISGDYISPTSILMKMKYVISIDTNEKYILVNFDANACFPISPLEFLIDRLKSVNEQPSYELSVYLEKYKDFRDVITKLKENTSKKEVLDDLNPNLVALLHSYYKNMVTRSIEEDCFQTFINDYLEKIKKCAVFGVVYNEYKPITGIQMTGILINKKMKSLICENAFEFLNLEFLLIKKTMHYNYNLQTLKSFISPNKEDSYEFDIKTKRGIKKMNFLSDIWYINLKNGAKKILVFFKEKKCENPQCLKKNPLKRLDAKTQEEKKKTLRKIENNNNWKNIMNIYFQNLEGDNQPNLTNSNKE